MAQSQQEAPIYFNFLPAITPGERSALSGECDGTTASAEITCRFTQAMIRYALDPKDIETETEKLLKQLRREAEKDWEKFTEQFCGEIRKNGTEAQERIRELKNTVTQNWLIELVTLCKNPTIAALEDLMKRSILAESKTCKVSHFQNDPIKFTKISPNKWRANVGPKVICSSVNLYTMENEPKHTNRWRWTQIRTYADNSNEVCKGLQLNYTLEFSWKGDGAAMSCEYIKFGM